MTTTQFAAHVATLAQPKELNLNLLTNCHTCGTHHSIPVNQDDYEKYERGALIQNCLPYLDKQTRELIISGTCPDCWTKMFSEDNDETTNYEHVDGVASCLCNKCNSNDFA